MLFLGESDHRRFPLTSLQLAVRRSQFAARRNIWGVASDGTYGTHGTNVTPWCSSSTVLRGQP
jgi:hypothetical protein